MKECLKCKNIIPVRILIDGKNRNLVNRKYCLDCSPFGSNNRFKLHLVKEKPCKSLHHRDYKLMNEEERKICNHKSYIYQKNMRLRTKIKLVKLLGGACKCGYKANLSALHFHHKNPNDKLFEISRNLWRKSFDSLTEEALKCELLCANCHSEMHNPNDFNWDK